MLQITVKVGIKYLLLGLVLCMCILQVDAQNYFGRNKPAYKTFEYEVYQTPHYDIYHYFDNDSILNYLALSSEQWYNIHQKVFKDTFKTRNPIIFYANHLDFQQTNAIFGTIGVGTGGVTEALKNRVIMPVTESRAQTDHVLGHEMVHAFQYHSLLQGDSLSLYDVGNIPLWMVEGMAEYLSIGSVDAHTAMWMRDALLSDDFPSLSDLNNTAKYFPYRYGHSFWAFITKLYGDTIIEPLLNATARAGYNAALQKVVGEDAETVSNMWKIATKNHFWKMMPDSTDKTFGEKRIGRENSGNINIAPSISPNGEYIAFYSESEGLSVDLYLARAQNGEVIKRLTKKVRGGDIDAINFIESAGTWSPDSRKFAFVAQSKGKNKLIIVNTQNGDVISKNYLDSLQSFNNPAWHPHEDKLVLSVLHDGYSNLVLYDIKTKKHKWLTNTRYGNLQPNWSSDGKKIVFSTDQPLPQKQKLSANQKKYTYNIGIYHLETGKSHLLNLFTGANNLNPLFARNDSSIMFLSDADGFRNMYEYVLPENQIYRKTTLYRGISGITMLAPAMALARETNQLVYNYYENGKYNIYLSALDSFPNEKITALKLDNKAAYLPPVTEEYKNIVDNALSNRPPLNYQYTDSFEWKPYHPKFMLDYLGNTGGGVGVSYSQFGTGVHGGVAAIFSDITGNNVLFTSAAINGEVVDFGAQVSYMNQKHRVTWGVSGSHIPYPVGYQGRDTALTINPTTNDTTFYDVTNLYLLRIFQSGGSAFAFYPFSRTRRLEFSAGANWYFYRLDIQSYRFVNGDLEEVTRDKNVRENVPPSYAVQNFDLAFVEDNSYFGIASPLRGHRYRAQVSKNIGSIQFYSLLLDFRKYFRVSPVTFAMRGYHYGRYNLKGRKGLLNPIFIGYPWFVRGYETTAFAMANNLDDNDVSLNDLSSNRFVVTNFEVRLPFTGPQKLSVIRSKFLFTELNAFFDAGYTFKSEDFTDSELPFYNDFTPTRNETLITSAGLSLRINIFGLLVIEPYYAFPFQLVAGQSGYFGINFISGW